MVRRGKTAVYNRNSCGASENCGVKVAKGERTGGILVVQRRKRFVSADLHEHQRISIIFTSCTPTSLHAPYDFCSLFTVTLHCKTVNVARIMAVSVKDVATAMEKKQNTPPNGVKAHGF